MSEMGHSLPIRLVPVRSASKTDIRFQRNIRREELNCAVARCLCHFRLAPNCRHFVGSRYVTFRVQYATAWLLFDHLVGGG